MPKKQVVQYTCERCTRVWYLDSTAPEPDAKLRVSFTQPSSSKEIVTPVINYECLCDSCTDTVTALFKSLQPLKPRERRAKKKDESAAQEKSQTTDSTLTTSAAPAEPPVGAPASTPPAASTAAGSSGAGGQRPAPVNPSHPKR